MKETVFLILITVSLSSSLPGLLKIPKVYNALITSDQNLTPSRAFPVLQPVVHRTALGYVPPFYYPQFAPQYVPEGVDLMHAPVNKSDKEVEDKAKDEQASKEGGSANTQKKTETPLKFYPNYQTVLYEPYFYTYSGLGPQVEQATYQDYEKTQQMLDPLPPEAGGKYPERLLPHLHEEGEQRLEEKIPHVPPPPVPTSSPKNKNSS